MPKIEKIGVNLHQGSTLLHLAKMHKDGFQAVIELVQNLLDASPENARIIIDAKLRRIISLDDGCGANLSEMQKKFSQIGESLKKGDSETFGKKGIGSLSAYVVADKWEFTTRQKSNPEDPYRKYTLGSEQFAKASGIEVDVEELSTSVIGKNMLGVPATTQVVLHDVEKSIVNQLITGKQNLINMIQTSFNDKLKQLRINLTIDCRHADGHTERIDVKPREFRGTEQDPISIKTIFGNIVFRLFVNPKPLRDPVLRVSYTDPVDHKRYGFPISLITTGHTKTKSETKQFLEKGFFEGTIELGFGSMTPDRLGFIDDSEYKAFVEAVDKVVRETLREAIEKIESEQRDDKLREIADAILNKFRNVLKNNPLLVGQLGNKLASQLGLDGVGSGDPASWVELPKEKAKRKNKEPRKTLLSEVNEKDPKKEGSKGSRKVLPNNGIGIIFVYPGDEESFNWHYRVRFGVLEFNCANDSFVRCSSTSMLEEYCMMMLTTAIAEVVTPSSTHEGYSKLLELWVELKLQNNK